MKTFAVLCNVLSIAFTCLVMATDGPPTKPAYVVFSALLVAIPIFTVVALVRSRALARTAAVCNLVLIAFIAWALVDQYPHPDEAGYVPYVVLMLFTPVLSAAVLFLTARGGGRRGSPVEKLSVS